MRNFHIQAKKKSTNYAYAILLSLAGILSCTTLSAKAQLDKQYQQQQTHQNNLEKLCLRANLAAQYWHYAYERNALTAIPSKDLILQTLKDPYSEYCTIEKTLILGKSHLLNGVEVLYKIEDDGIIEYSKDASGRISRVVYGKPKYKYSKENKQCNQVRAKAQYQDPVKRNIYYTYDASTWGLWGSEINPNDSTCKIILYSITWKSFPANWKDIQEIYRIEQDGVLRYTKDSKSGEITKTLIGIPIN